MGSPLIGSRLKQLRVSAGYTQQQVASLLMLKNKSTLASWESGKSEPDALTFLILCDLYGVPASTELSQAFGISDAVKDFYPLLREELDSQIEEKDRSMLEIDEYPIITKYRCLNDSGKEYIDSQLDFAFSQEKYRLGLAVAEKPEDPAGAPAEAETVDIYYAAYGGDSGKVTIPKSQFDEAMKELEKYDYRNDN